MRKRASEISYYKITALWVSMLQVNLTKGLLVDRMKSKKTEDDLISSQSAAVCEKKNETGLYLFSRKTTYHGGINFQLS